MKEYDYLIVGSGLFGATFAHQATQKGKKCLVIDRRSQVGGNVFCHDWDGIQVHVYGPHIFHTNDEDLWNYVNSFTKFNRYTHAPMAYGSDGVLYNLPFNMNTFHQLWGISTPDEALRIIEADRSRFPIKAAFHSSVQDKALAIVGKEIYEKLIEGYTQKQWGRHPSQLPSNIIARLPIRFTYDNNYFNDKYQGIPVHGYNPIIDGMLQGSEVMLNADYFDNREYFDQIATKVVYSGSMDEFFDYRCGVLEYRSLMFQSQMLPIKNYQGSAVVNYCNGVPHTRIIEHKHFVGGDQDFTVITKEFPIEWKRGMDQYYPINDTKNTLIYKNYSQLALDRKNVIFGGRLAEYRYYDMHQVIASALAATKKEFTLQ